MLLLLQENTLKSPPSIKYRRAAGERCCKQTAEIEHWHVALDPSVYHRLYILHRLCLKISPHIQTTAPVCVWGTSARCVHTEKKKKSIWMNREERICRWLRESCLRTFCKQRVTGQSTWTLCVWGQSPQPGDSLPISWAASTLGFGLHFRYCAHGWSDVEGPSS